jgi:hypothetical protein
MIDVLPNLLIENRQEVYLLLRRFRSLEKPLLAWSDLTYEFDRFCETGDGTALRDTHMRSLIRATQEPWSTARRFIWPSEAEWRPGGTSWSTRKT